MGTCSSTCTDKNQPRSVKEEPRSPSDTQPLSPDSSSGAASSAPCECRPSSAPSGSTPSPLVMWALSFSHTDAVTSVRSDTALCGEGFHGCRVTQPCDSCSSATAPHGGFLFLQEFCARKSRWQRTGEGSPKLSTQLSLCPTRTSPMATITMPSLTVSKAKAHHYGSQKTWGWGRKKLLSSLVVLFWALLQSPEN